MFEMTERILQVICFLFPTLFGVVISVAFLGIRRSGRNTRLLFCFCCYALVAQNASWYLFGMEQTKQIFPFLVHLPLIAFLSLCFKRPWFRAMVALYAAYLCLQAPRWVALVVFALTQGWAPGCFCYIVANLLTAGILLRSVCRPVSIFIAQSTKNCLLFGIIPLAFYLFDYITTVYTNLLYEGSSVVVEFIPSVVAVSYFAFILIYHAEIQRQTERERLHEQLEGQFRLAYAEIDILQRSQEQTMQYRHDMRHHFALLSALAAEGNIGQMKEYLRTAQADLDAFTPVRYCENETASLLLSAFAARADRLGIMLEVKADIPKQLPVSDTELCSLLSNGLENAIAAASGMQEGTVCCVTFRAAVYQGNLLFCIENPYQEETHQPRTVPASPEREGHGYGTRSITAIAEAHGGQALFLQENGIFTLKIVLPLRKG